MNLKKKKKKKKNGPQGKLILKDLLAIGREPVHYENTPMQKYSDFFHITMKIL